MPVVQLAYIRLFYDIKSGHSRTDSCAQAMSHILSLSVSWTTSKVSEIRMSDGKVGLSRPQSTRLDEYQEHVEDGELSLLDVVLSQWFKSK